MSIRIAGVVAVLAAAVASAADDDRHLKVVTAKSLPAFDSVTVFAAGTVTSGKERPKPLATLSKFADAAVLPGAGPFDIYATPKGGLPVLVAAKLAVKPGQTHELKLGDVLGAVEVFQNDDAPKAEKIVVTAPDDPGPDEKGHMPVQVGSDYRVEMPVPEGFYAVWVVPANGARAQRVADRVRVLTGRTIRVGGE